MFHRCAAIVAYIFVPAIHTFPLRPTKDAVVTPLRTGRLAAWAWWVQAFGAMVLAIVIHCVCWREDRPVSACATSRIQARLAFHLMPTCSVEEDLQSGRSILCERFSLLALHALLDAVHHWNVLCQRATAHTFQQRPLVVYRLQINKIFGCNSVIFVWINVDKKIRRLCEKIVVCVLLRIKHFHGWFLRNCLNKF